MRSRIPVDRTFAVGSLLAALAVLAVPFTALAKRAPDPQRRPALLATPVTIADIEETARPTTSATIQKRYGIETRRLRRYWDFSVSEARVSSAPARQIATEFLRANAAELGLEAAAPERNLTFTSEKSTPSGTHLRWDQQINGVPVWRSDLVVKVSNSGRVSSVQNNLRPTRRVITDPQITRERALEIGLAAVQPTGRPLADYTAELRIVEFASGHRLVYMVNVANEQPMGDWMVYVDALNGAVIGAEDRLVYATGTGRVFDPDPETKTGNNNLRDSTDANFTIPFPGAYDTRTLLDITNTAGTYSLDGPFARMIDFESPASAPITATHPDSFQFQRNPQSFEEVLVYYHIDSFQRYIQSLGFTNANNRVQELDAHGLSDADNSHYVIGSTRIAFGDGGVDDGEDADIVIHEYGHSIQHNIVPSWGGGQEGAMGEGFGDYLAGSYSRTLYPAHEPNFVFNWDGHNEFWPGRLLIDTAMHYPEDCCGEVHDSGTLWCSGLMDAWEEVGRTVMDRLVIDHHFSLGSSATMADAAAQIIQSDFDLYGGTHVGQLVAVFDLWGFVDAEDFIPSIAHTPLTDTENTTGPYVVTATITSVQPLDGSSLKLHYGTTGSFTDSLPLIATGNPNEYSASIPGPLSNVDVRYYLVAKDNAGGTATHPSGAPGNFHQFHVGADVLSPVITHSAITQFPRIQWPANVQAQVTDNLGVNDDSVRVNWDINGTSQQPFYLVRIGLTDNYTGGFPSDTTEVVVGDIIHYAITARDLATTPNTASHPTSGTHAFPIIASRGLVLVLDDDDVAKQTRSKLLTGEEAGKGGPLLVQQTPVPGGTVQSAAEIAQILNDLGFTASVEVASTSNPSTWSDYALLISASGGNEAPVASAPYRTALESWVAGGGKLLVEGGEVVYDAASSPGYPTFASNVLHSTDWDADAAGALQLLGPQAGHPIATIPNAIPSSLAIAYTGFGSEDSYKPSAPAYIVYGVTAQAGNGGILVYDNNLGSESAQIVVLGADFKDVGTLQERTDLLENTVQYLLAPEAAPSSGMNGRVWLAGQTNHGGVLITANPSGVTTLSDASGYYSLSGLYAFPYSVSASKAGYLTISRIITTSVNAINSHENFVLYPPTITSQCLTPGTAIPDNNPVGVTSNMTVVPSFTVAEVAVSVNIPHTFIGDLIVELRHGAKNVRLHNRSGGGADNLVATYPPTAVSGPGALADFTGDPSAGTWTLFVSDNAGADLGNIAQWCLELRGADSSFTVDAPNATPRAVAFLAPSQPNPVRSNGAMIRFGLATRGQASLEVFDVTGRKVRTLVDGVREAGDQQVRWDARDGAGHPLPAGLYLYRLRTGAFEASQRMVLVP